MATFARSGRTDSTSTSQRIKPLLASRPTYISLPTSSLVSCASLPHSLVLPRLRKVTLTSKPLLFAFPSLCRRPPFTFQTHFLETSSDQPLALTICHTNSSLSLSLSLSLTSLDFFHDSVNLFPLLVLRFIDSLAQFSVSLILPSSLFSPHKLL
jgi:hypothetical protein